MTINNVKNTTSSPTPMRTAVTRSSMIAAYPVRASPIHVGRKNVAEGYGSRAYPPGPSCRPSTYARTGTGRANAMTLRGFGAVALLLALAVVGMVALSHRVSPKEAQNTTTTTQLCHDVGTLEKAIADVRAGTLSGEQAMARLDQAQQAFALDAQHEQSPVVAPHVASLAIDIADWRTALFSGDAASQTPALDHARSELASLPAC